MSEFIQIGLTVRYTYMPKHRIRKKPHAVSSLTSIPLEEPGLTDPTQYLDEIDSYHQSRTTNLKKRASADNFKDHLLSASEGETSSGEYHEREEVLPLDLSSSEADAEEQIGEMREYFSDQSEESVGAEVGWGSKKRTFYDTDFVGDEKKGQREQTELALEEEREALSLQKRLTSGLTEKDYLTHDLLSTLSISRPDPAYDTTKDDNTVLAESPELNELIQDLQSHISLLNSLILPSLSIARNITQPPSNLLLYLNTYSSLSLSYCCSILFYLSLRASGVAVATHPVCERLVTSRALLSQLTVLNKDLQPELESWLQQKLNDTDISSDINPIGLNNGDNPIENSQELIDTVSDKNSVTELNLPNPATEVDRYASLTPLEFYDVMMRERKERKKLKKANKHITTNTEEENIVETGETKRPINYDIKKNKGLTPRRKKELRNPRVRQRMKYKRALKNRKGQVAGTRPRTSLYPGELTGIRDDISKSRKIR
ncbi:hypothetical protein LOD99_8953 [Oopsacas minuta]|uniref:Sas10 C-terminal domain-containing protein n=1 Tax=Oopsacas minuta TaxID=111878 RepID=A0AAV7JF26_9METZ|nr:hypothetical protein LOD99_8953 [Oopsacas minuta]